MVSDGATATVSPSSSNTGSAAISGVCSSVGCGKPAALKCPTCLQLNLSPTLFCSQDCFKAAWKSHNMVHKIEKARLEFTPPPFAYTGKIRPAYVTPMRTVPDHIQKPEYSLSGTPISEQRLKANNTIPIHTSEEIAGVREACRIGRLALDLAHRMIKPGITTDAIDAAVHDFIVGENAYPSPLNYHFFPKSCCTSINEVICHGIPDCRLLEAGDIINVDVSVFKNGFHGDLNETFTVGEVDNESKMLIKATHDSLMACIAYAKPGVMVREFGDLITKHVGKFGLSVVRTYCGHGIGRMFHGPPNVPHYSKNKAIGVLKPGMILTIEPMINLGTYRDVLWPDDWTSTTVDGKRSAQFEHTLVVTDTGVEVLTARTADSPKFFWEIEGVTDTNVYAGKASAATSSSSSSSSSSSTTSSNETKEESKADVKAAPTAAEDGDDGDEGEEEGGDGGGAAEKKKKKKKKKNKK